MIFFAEIDQVPTGVDPGSQAPKSHTHTHTRTYTQSKITRHNSRSHATKCKRHVCMPSHTPGPALSHPWTNPLTPLDQPSHTPGPALSHPWTRPLTPLDQPSHTPGSVELNLQLNLHKRRRHKGRAVSGAAVVEYQVSPVEMRCSLSFFQ